MSSYNVHPLAPAAGLYPSAGDSPFNRQRVSRTRRIRMRGKVVVREHEDIAQALKRLRRQVSADRASDKWPVWAGHYAKPSEKRHRKLWLRAMKLKWQRIWEQRHRKQLAKYPSAEP